MSLDAARAALFEAVRGAASPKLWSVGVTIARADRVRLEREAGAELTLRVTAPQVSTPFTVGLDLELCGWGCDCPSREDPCAHVVAAVIALEQAKTGGRAMAASTRKKLALEWRFDRALAPSRAWVGEGEPERPAARGLELSALEGSHDVERLDADLAADRLLERHRRLESAQLVELLTILHGHPRVRFDGRPVRVDRAPLLPRGRVRRDGDLALFVVEAPPELGEVLAPGLALAEGAIRPLGETGLAGARWERLPMTRRFARADWAELFGEHLPLMEARFPIERAPGLPRRGPPEAPRVELALRFGRGGLSVDPSVVYGRPPAISVVDKRAVYLEGDVPPRDRAEEQALLLRLRDELNLALGRRVELSGADAQRFLDRLRAWNERTEHEAQRFDLEARGGALAPILEGEDVGFVSAGGGRADARAVLDAWRGGFSSAPLLEGGFAPLPAAWLAEHGHRLLLLLSAKEERGEVPAALLPELARVASSLDAPPPPRLEALRPLLAGFSGVPRAPRPADLRATLRPYQEQGIDWLCFLRGAGLGAVLADDMGLGKTLQACAVLERRALVVCPTSVVPNWARELARFRPGLRVSVFHGPRRAFDPDADVVITTYPLLRLEEERLAAERWRTVVLDEAQSIKNPDSQAARAAFRLRADFRMSLSGTPLENRLEELWSQLHFTNPGVLGGRGDFDERYTQPIAEGHAERAAELRARVRPFVLRRVKEEVAPELPPRTEGTLYVELDEAERRVYEAVLAATKRELVARLDAGASALGVLEALLRLRQAACHAALVPGQTASRSSKLEVLVESLREVAAAGHRALVFSQWTALLDLAEPALEAAGLSYLRLDGATLDRGAVVDRFQAAGGPPVFLISLKAGGTGLNLTAADHVYFLDPWWNPAVEEQAADRAHRIGQDKPVLVLRLVAQGTVEERILALQERKRQLAEVALGEGGAAAPLTREELLALLD